MSKFSLKFSERFLRVTRHLQFRKLKWNSIENKFIHFTKIVLSISTLINFLQLIGYYVSFSLVSHWTNARRIYIYTMNSMNIYCKMQNTVMYSKCIKDTSKMAQYPCVHSRSEARCSNDALASLVAVLTTVIMAIFKPLKFWGTGYSLRFNLKTSELASQEPGDFSLWSKMERLMWRPRPSVCPAVEVWSLIRDFTVCPVSVKFFVRVLYRPLSSWSDICESRIHDSNTSPKSMKEFPTIISVIIYQLGWNSV